MSSTPCASIGTTFSTAPVCSATICHGTMLEWCSMRDKRISSPGFRRGRAKLYATRLSAAVQPRVKTISADSRALKKRAIRSRAPS